MQTKKYKKTKRPNRFDKAKVIENEAKNTTVGCCKK